MQRTVTVFGAVAIMLAPSYAAEFWASKPYQKWSAQECHKVLWDSPWGKSYTMQKTIMRQLNRDPFGQGPRGQARQNTTNDQEGVDEPRVTYHASFRSARPVRQAFAQVARIEAKFDQMSDEQRKNFDERQKKFLAVTFPDKIIIHVAYESNAPQVDRELAHYWQTQTLGSLKQTVYLSGPDGERAEPIEYYVGSGALREFQFAFPRKPASDLDLSKPLLFEFRHPTIGSVPEERVLLKYQSSEMKFDGALTY